ncbi:MAG: DoxX family protein [Bacteroidia bacterium]
MAFYFFTAVPDALNNNEAVQFMHGKLGYPIYIIPFIGIVKILGAIAILIPGFARIKEWAYAGLMIDLIGATYSLLMNDGGMQAFGFMSLIIIVGVVSYIYHHKKLERIV